jgi:ABC-type nitrate/sulfonate/bicarbonate transport system permease component
VPDDVYLHIYRSMGRTIQGFMGFVGLGTCIAVIIGIVLGLSSKMLQKINSQYTHYQQGTLKM